MNTKPFLFLALLLSALNFSSCTKDDLETEFIEPTIAELPIVLSEASSFEGITDNTETTFKYGENDRLIERSESKSSFYSTLEYSASKVIEKFYKNDKDLIQTITYKLNSEGLATESHRVTKYPNIPDIKETQTYEYDNNGYLIKKVSVSGNGNVTTTSYTVTDGNVTNMKKSSIGTPALTTSFSYLTDKQNTIGNENCGTSFLGKQNKNLIASKSVSDGTNTNTTTYSYDEYDEKGRATKQITVFSSSLSESVETISKIFTYSN